MPRAIITHVLLLVSLGAARADLRIVSSAGGEVGPYLQFFAAVRQSGERVIIDGPCLSACTLPEANLVAEAPNVVAAY